MMTKRRRRWSNALLVLGSAATIVGLATAFGGIGLGILVFVPVPFTAAAVVARSRWGVAAALFVWGCWFFALYHVLT